MANKKRIYQIGLLVAMMIATNATSYAQNSPLEKARMFAETDKEKAASLYKELYRKDPMPVYNEYFHLLLAMKDVKTAKKIAEDRLAREPQSPIAYIDLGQATKEEGKEGKANDYFDKALDFISGENVLTQQVANTFLKYGNEPYAIRTYERAKDMTRNPYMYYNVLSSLYMKQGEVEKALNALLEAAPAIPGGVADIKATLLDITEGDSKTLRIAQKELIKRINQNPQNTLYGELLTWIYTQRDDWEGALQQVVAIDLRNNEHGQRVMTFAKEAARARQYEIALQALDEIAEMGNQEALYAMAKSQKLEIALMQLEDLAKPDTTFVKTISSDYDSFFEQHPQYYTSPSLLAYARIEAQYNDNPQKAIEILDKAIDNPAGNRGFAGSAKLMKGDYQLLTGKIWDASLTYSQVDKAFKEDMLGEEARFRNAKLAYYRGDFNWAQTQLSVLKASTSELIANDALYLSVLITENIPPDSNYTPLERFAYADLLLFQNKDQKALTLLDSISKAFPEHPLNDDIILLKAKLAMKQKDYNKALDLLKDIYVKYGKDVLGDDAVYRTAEIYEQKLNDKEKAQHFYEQLIIDYPGSTYTQNARKRLKILVEGEKDPEAL